MSTPKIITDPAKLIFAMDIGTRSIVGLVCYPDNEKLHILASEILFHPQRDMQSGQIQNISGVAETARQVKTKLEEQLGVPLERVCIAAAGRALKTRRYLLNKEVVATKRISQIEIDSLELEAVEKAREALYEEESITAKDPYYCVGYSTVSYFLDGYPITSLLGQKGLKAGIEVLATFLPQVVIDSLITVVEKLGLTVHNLTLEPIAALHITIPPEYRSLNLALVDIGAGTSDIAITHKGAVIGYAMVPQAGDEISEYIAEKYLLDFNTAESVKLNFAQNNADVHFQDILGNEYCLSAEEMRASLEPAVEKLAHSIAETIKEYNNGPPRAVFLVGGGSQTPYLREKIAEKLGLPLEMMALRGKETTQKIIYPEEGLHGPEYVTPIGIAVSALQKEYYGFSYMTVNDKVIRLLDTENLKVGNVLLAAGFTSQMMLGRRSPGLRIHLNDREKYFPGNAGESALIRVNGEKASLESNVKNNDRIEVEEATDGAPLKIRVKDLLPLEMNIVEFDGRSCLLPLNILLNGEITSEGEILKNGDKLEWSLGRLQDFLERNNLAPTSAIFKINGITANSQDKLYPGDKITSSFIDDKTAIHEVEAAMQNTEVTIQETETTTQNEIFVENRQRMIAIHVNDETIYIPADSAPSFAIIFDYINFDLSRPQGKLVMIHNGEQASLAGELTHNDSIKVYWE